MHPNVHSSTIYNSKDMKTTQVPINGRMFKEEVVHIYNGILLSHKMEQIGSFVEMWMNLETVTQSEVRKRKTNIVY